MRLPLRICWRRWSASSQGWKKKSRIINPRERERVAYHEMGHALVAMALPGTDPVQKVSVIPRGISALGYTIQRPLDDRFLLNLEEKESRMAVLLGAMVMRYGMDKKMGAVSYDADRHSFLDTSSVGQRSDSEQTGWEIDCAVRELVNQALFTATKVLTHVRGVLERGARELLEKETLGEAPPEALQGELAAELRDTAAAASLAQPANAA